MALLRWQQNIVDEAGNVLASAEVEIRDEVSGALVNLFEDIDGNTVKGNPLTVDSDGYGFAYMEPGRFKITATSADQSFTKSWRDVRLANDFSELDDRINQLGEESSKIREALSPIWLNYDASSSDQQEEVVPVDTDFHQGFGYCAADMEGRIYLCWRKGTEHGIEGAGQILMQIRDNDGFTVISTATLVAPDPGRDLRDPMPCVTPTGRVVIVYTDTSSTNVSGGTDPTHFRFIYSDDGGSTFSDPETITTINFNYARTYGGLKITPSTRASARTELSFTAYYQLNATPEYVVDWRVSQDDGITWQSANDIGEARIMDPGEGGHNETSMGGVNPTTWFAVGRASDAIHLKVSTDGRQTWSAWETIPWTSSGTHVAPYLNIVPGADGTPYVLIAVSDRTNDWLEFSAARASDVATVGAAAFPSPTKSFDTTNAYPACVAYPNGQLLVTFTREFAGFDHASFHVGRFSYGELVTRRGPFGFSTTNAAADTGQPVVISAGEVDYTSPYMTVDTEGAAASDTLETINGGRVGDLLILETTAGSRDIVISHGSGNIQLAGGANITLTNSINKLVLMRMAPFWVEVSRAL